MIVVTSHTSGTRVELRCCVCEQLFTLASAWLAFPVDAEGTEGRWLHERCAKSRIRTLFGQERAVLMRGTMALSHLATSLYRTNE
jgi:hypothetical protein